MATTTLAAVDNLIKEIFEPGLQDSLQSEAKARKRIEKTSEGVTHEVSGKWVTFGIRTKRNHGIGARSENEALPIAGTQSYERARVPLKFRYGSLQITGQTMELAETNAQAFVSALDAEINGLKEGISKDENRQLFGTSAGKLATATGAGTTTTFVVANAFAQYLEEGMFVDIFQSNDSVRVADATITGISVGATDTTVTFTPAAGGNTASGDYMTRDNSRNKELTGFAEIAAATGVLHNLNPATAGQGSWAASVDANGGTPRPISEGLMIKMVDTIKTKGGGIPTVVFCSLGVRRSYFNLLVQQRRQHNTTKFDGGFSGLAFTTDDGEIPIVSDVDCQPNRMYFMNEKQIKLFEAGDWSFMDRDGSKWRQVVTSAGSFDAYSSTLYKYDELGTHRRNAHGLLADITEG